MLKSLFYSFGDRQPSDKFIFAKFSYKLVQLFFDVVSHCEPNGKKGDNPHLKLNFSTLQNYKIKIIFQF